MLGTPELKVRNGATRIVYPSGAIYEGQVKDRKRYVGLLPPHVVVSFSAVSFPADVLAGLK